MCITYTLEGGLSVIGYEVKSFYSINKAMMMEQRKNNQSFSSRIKLFVY